MEMPLTELEKTGGETYGKGRKTENYLDLSSLIGLADIQDWIQVWLDIAPNQNVSSKRTATFVCLVHCCSFRTSKRRITGVQ